MRVLYVFLAAVLAMSYLTGTTGIATASERSLSVTVVFSEEEIRLIRAYYANSRDNQRGRGKARGLPPGIAKNLQRGKTLPPGIAKQALPNDLVASLPPVPDGHERIVVAGKVLLIEIATQVVRDVLTDVLF